MHFFVKEIFTYFIGTIQPKPAKSKKIISLKMGDIFRTLEFMELSQRYKRLLGRERMFYKLLGNLI